MNFQPDKRTLLLPAAGIFLFVLCYIIAALQYPGGSAVDKQSEGFSFRNNYWCNLLNEYALNGSVNSGRSVAIAGMIILCISLGLFFLLIPFLLKANNPLKRIVPISGLLAVIFVLSLPFASDHDRATNLASLSGMIALLGTILIIYRKRWPGLFFTGLALLIVVGINNYFYYSPELIQYLPVIQKISFLLFLSWILAVIRKSYSQS